MLFISDLNYLMMDYSRDKGYIRAHGYGPIYNRYFSNVNINNIYKVLEIGVANENSHLLWKNYFRKATYFGYDAANYKRFESPRVCIFQGHQENRKHLQKFINQYGSNFDIIIDDGGHKMNQQQISFGFLFQHLIPGGLYVCEDLFTSEFVPKFKIYKDGLPKNSPTTFEMFQDLEKGIINSFYMTEEEKRRVKKGVAFCKIEKGNFSEIAFIKKRNLLI